MILKSFRVKINLSFQPTNTKDKNTYNALTFSGGYFFYAFFLKKLLTRTSVQCIIINVR
nr:MAG TPA: hypothetical protein [Caudoviricetes sp.]